MTECSTIIRKANERGEMRVENKYFTFMTKCVHASEGLSCWRLRQSETLRADATTTTTTTFLVWRRLSHDPFGMIDWLTEWLPSILSLFLSSHPIPSSSSSSSSTRNGDEESEKGKRRTSYEFLFSPKIIAKEPKPIMKLCFLQKPQFTLVSFSEIFFSSSEAFWCPDSLAAIESLLLLQARRQLLLDRHSKIFRVMWWRNVNSCVSNDGWSDRGGADQLSQ